MLVVAGLIGGILVFPLDYFGNSNVLIGLGLFPFALFIEGRKRHNLIYAGLAIVFAVLASIYSVRIFYFFAVAFYFLWLIELFIGALSVLVVFLILFASPFFIQVVTILGFPLRLMLSEYAGFLLNLVGTNVHVEGNMMILNGRMFSVDEACMGLNMLSISMLMGVSVIVCQFRLWDKSLGLWPMIFFFGFVLVLNVITNVIRIIALVYFQVPPEDPMHEIIGVLCLLCYVVMPLYFFGNWIMRKYGKARNETAWKNGVAQVNILFLALPAVILIAGVRFKSGKQASVTDHADIQFAGATPELLADGITKVSTEQLLIYVKPIPEFFTGEHTPLMCWKGSGYELSGITTITIAGVPVYRGTLVKGESVLYTAWWYTNGEVNTISQLDWRLRTLRGEDKFCLVNVTAKSVEALNESIVAMLKDELLIIAPRHSCLSFIGRDRTDQ
jgi:exosortase N